MTPYVQMLAARLRPEAQATFAYEYGRYAKDPSIALLLTLLLGIIGGESYYLGDYKRGILMSIGFFSGIGLLVTIPIWITHCFTVQNECDGYNDYLAYSLALRYWPAVDANAPQPPQPPAQPRRSNISGVPMRVANRS